LRKELATKQSPPPSLRFLAKTPQEYVLRAVSCAGLTTTTQTARKRPFALCAQCFSLSHLVNEKVRAATTCATKAPSRFEPLASILKDPTKIRQRMEQQSRERKAEKQRERRAQAKRHREETGVDLLPGEEQDAITDAILEVDKAGNEELANAGFSEGTLERMIWEEAVDNAQKVKASGTRLVARYIWHVCENGGSGVGGSCQGVLWTVGLGWRWGLRWCFFTK
jgi:TolA-binding protein